MPNKHGGKLASEVLVSAVKVIQSHGWHNGRNGASEAVDASGRICRAESTSAVAFTALGAIKRAAKDRVKDDWVSAAAWLRLASGEQDLHRFNTKEGQTRAGVLFVFDEAILRAQAKGE